MPELACRLIFKDVFITKRVGTGKEVRLTQTQETTLVMTKGPSVWNLLRLIKDFLEK